MVSGSTSRARARSSVPGDMHERLAARLQAVQESKHTVVRQADNVRKDKVNVGFHATTDDEYLTRSLSSLLRSLNQQADWISDMPGA